MRNRLPTGPGSRGGTYHLDRSAYDRAWRAGHPDYRDRERLRMARKRAGDVTVLPAGTLTRPLPRPADHCACDCGCREAVVIVCGFCREGMCHESG